MAGLVKLQRGTRSVNQRQVWAVYPPSIQSGKTFFDIAATADHFWSHFFENSSLAAR
jgi:hypothetical protein